MTAMATTTSIAGTCRKREPWRSLRAAAASVATLLLASLLATGAGSHGGPQLLWATPYRAFSWAILVYAGAGLLASTWSRRWTLTILPAAAAAFGLALALLWVMLGPNGPPSTPAPMLQRLLLGPAVAAGPLLAFAGGWWVGGRVRRWSEQAATPRAHRMLILVTSAPVVAAIAVSTALWLPDSVRYYTTFRSANIAISCLDQYRARKGHLPATLAEAGCSTRGGRPLEYFPSCCPDRADEYSMSFHISDLEGLSWNSRTREWKRVWYEICFF
jgi:hypothetical protein